MTQEPTHIGVVEDFVLLQTTTSLYLLISLYIGLSNVLYVCQNWRRLRLEGVRGSILMHLSLVLTSLFFICENVWNQVNAYECRKDHWIKRNCIDWKRIRNALSAISEALAISFFWFRGQTFYQNPILNGLFISNELKSKILSYTLLILIIIYPAAYTTYSMSNFWLDHHKYNYLVIEHLCYLNYTNNSYSPIGFSRLFRPVDLIETTGMTSLQHKDPIPMILSSGFQFMQLLLHFLVIIPFLVPFIRFVRDRERDMPEVNTLLRRCLLVTGVVLTVNVFSWVLGHLLAPLMPVSKFLLDAIADSRICVGLILAMLTMSNWRHILMPWRGEKAARMLRFFKDSRKHNSTENTILTNTLADNS